MTAKGPTGHGSRFISGFSSIYIVMQFLCFIIIKLSPNILDTAISKLLKFCNIALDFRQQQEIDLGFNGEGCAHAQVFCFLFICLLFIVDFFVYNFIFSFANFFTG